MGKLAHLKRGLAAYKTRTAHHGSPHDFDEFSMEKIGTGEGAQAYGHGLYFSGSEDIAKYYRDALTPPDKFKRVKIDGQWAHETDLSDHTQNIADMLVQFHGKDMDTRDVLAEYIKEQQDSIARADSVLSDYPNAQAATLNKQMAEQSLEAAQPLIGRKLEIADESPGSLYQVEIPDESHMLDWDAPLNKQLPEIQDIARQFLKDEGYLRPDDNGPRQLTTAWKSYAMERGGFAREGDGATLLEGITRRIRKQADDRVSAINVEQRELAKAMEADSAGGFRQFRSETGQQAAARYDELMEEKMSLVQAAQQPEASASQYLREQGIPGITYKGATSDERNFVVFDDNLIDIKQKGFADPKLLAATAGAAAFAQRRDAKRHYWDSIKQMGEAAMTVGSSVAGGMVGDLSRLGGYLNPAMPVEETEAGAQAIEQGMQYVPSGANPILEGLQGGMGVFQEDIERGLDRLNIEESVPNKIYEALPERAQGLVRAAGNLAF